MPLNDVAPFRVLPRRPLLSHLRRDVPQVTSAIIDQARSGRGDSARPNSPQRQQAAATT
jgi:hypothetical protein